METTIKSATVNAMKTAAGAVASGPIVEQIVKTAQKVTQPLIEKIDNLKKDTKTSGGAWKGEVSFNN